MWPKNLIEANPDWIYTDKQVTSLNVKFDIVVQPHFAVWTKVSSCRPDSGLQLFYKYIFM